jgi:hypothetical protein
MALVGGVEAIGDELLVGTTPSIATTSTACLCRYRPRGLRKDAVTWIDWTEFRRRYLAEMHGQRDRAADR